MTFIDGYDPTRLTVFVSYAWDKAVGRADEVRTFAKHLKYKQKLNVWLDEQEMYGSAGARMTEGIDESDVVLMFFSQAYQDSRNCNREAMYADQNRKPILPIKVQENFRPKAWLSFIIGDRIWIDFKADASLDAIAGQVMAQLYPLFDESKFTENDRRLGKFRIIDYDSKLHAIKKISKGGLMVLAGDKGVGKTYFVSLLLEQPENRRFLMNECNIGTALWLNCCPWYDERKFEEGERQQFQAELLKLVASATKRGLANPFASHVKLLTEKLKAPPLFVFDDVYHYPLLAFIRDQCGSLPCIVITPTECSDEMQLRTRPCSGGVSLTPRDSLTLWYQVVGVFEILPRLSDDAIRKMLRDTFGLKMAEGELRLIASSCNGLPREAANLAGQLASKGKEAALINSPAPLPTLTFSNAAWAINKVLGLRDSSNYEKPSAETVLPEMSFIHVPKFDNYFVRLEEEDGLRKGIRCLCRKSATDDGFFVVEGCGGIGKSTLMAHVLQDPKHNAYFQRECDFQVIIWLNCYEWRDGFDGNKAEERKFLSELLTLGGKADHTVTEGFKTLNQMLEHFASKAPWQRLLFVLDDVFDYTILDSLRTECKHVLCCAVTRDATSLKRPSFDPFLKMEDQIANPYPVGYLTESRVLEILQQDFRLKDKLNNEQLVELARRSCGMPLIANLIGGQLRDCRNYEKAYRKLVEECKLGGLVVGRTGRGEKMASQLFESAWRSLSWESRHRYYAFLLFNPVEQVSGELLRLLWDDCEDMDEVYDTCGQWERLSLVRNVSQPVKIDQVNVCHQNYLIHQILHESALRAAVDEFKISGRIDGQKGAKSLLSNLRVRLLLGDGGETDVANMLKCLSGVGEYYMGQILSRIDNEAFQFLENTTSKELISYIPKEMLPKASEYGHYHLAKFLIEIGCDADCRDQSGRTALLLAARKGYLSIAGLLISKAKNKCDHEAALRNAAENGHKEMVELLTSAGTDVDAVDEDGKTALMYAICSGYDNVIELLLSKGAKTEVCGVSGETALMQAAFWGRYKAARLLISKGACINAVDLDGQTALIKAASSGHEKIIELLLSKGVEETLRSKSGETALMHAAFWGREKAVEVLASKGALIEAVDEDGQTALMKAAYCGHLKVVEVLMNKGSQLEATDKDGKTALMSASAGGRDKVVQLLLLKGAKIDARSKCGETALLNAAIWGRGIVTKLLISAGANVDAATESGRTALSTAAYWGHSQLVDLLITTGRAEIERKDNRGNTALMWAASRGHDKVVQVLIDRGARTDATDDKGRTALMKAIHKGHDIIVELLTRIEKQRPK